MYIGFETGGVKWLRFGVPIHVEFGIGFATVIHGNACIWILKCDQCMLSSMGGEGIADSPSTPTEAGSLELFYGSGQGGILDMALW